MFGSVRKYRWTLCSDMHGKKVTDRSIYLSKFQYIVFISAKKSEDRYKGVQSA